MIISLRPGAILKPSVVSMAAMLASLAAWVFPGFGVLRKGFESRAQLTLDAFVILTCWYLLIFMCFSVGEKVGSFLVPRETRLPAKLLDLNSDVIYYAFTMLSAVGILTTLITVFRTLRLEEALVAITLGQANTLKDALYEDYSVGLVSLRYLVLYSASLALYRIIRFKRYSPINLFNVFLLGLGTFLSSRLIFIATLLTVIFLLSFGKRTTRINVPKLLTMATALFLLLAVLNYSRNKNYYDQNNLSFGLAGVSEILAYLGSPFQAEIGAAGATADLVAGGDRTYRNHVDEEENLMTNSAFIHLHEQIGFSTWPYMAALCLFMGFVFAALASLGKTIFLLPCGAILYASAELWRLDLFQQGTFVIWFVFGVGLPLSVYVFRSLFAFASESHAITDTLRRIPTAKRAATNRFPDREDS